jgi:hypothetical protein
MTTTEPPCIVFLRAPGILWRIINYSSAIFFLDLDLETAAKGHIRRLYLISAGSNASR